MDARIVKLQYGGDGRGYLGSAEAGRDVPFPIERAFYIHDVPAGAVRGRHAHREGQQFVIAIRGSLSVLLSDGREQAVFRLSSAREGLYIPPMTWIRLSSFAPSTVILVLSNTVYMPERSLHNWEDFLEAQGVSRSPEPGEPRA